MNVVITGTAFVDGSLDTPATLVRELRRADPFIRYGVLATHELFKKLDQNSKPTEDCALCLGSSFGPMDTNFDVLDQVTSGEQTSPTLFSHSVFNAAAGYLSRIFRLHGPALTITEFSFPFFQAMQQAMLFLQSGQCHSCLVLHIESYSDLLHYSRQKHLGAAAPPWSGGAAAILLKVEEETDEKPVLTNLRVEPQNVTPESYLESPGNMQWRKNVAVLSSPLDACKNFCQIVEQLVSGEELVTISGASGTVHFKISSP